MRFRSMLLIVALLMASGNARAQACSINVTPMAFGTLESAAGVAIDSVGNITFVCDAQVSYLVRLDSGQNSGTFVARIMRVIGGAATLDYNLFRDAAMSLIWGDGTGGSSIVQGTSPGAGESISVYGRIYGGQKPPPGTYIDTVTVIVEW